MNTKKLLSTTKKHLEILCSDISERNVGSKGNRLATDYVKSELQKSDWKIEETLLSVMDWRTDGATLTCGEQSFEVFPSPYSLGCSLHGELLAINSIEELEKCQFADKIVLLYGQIASEQVMPKNFVFYNPEDHQRIISALEQGKPKAIICATERNSVNTGGVYPFPMFEDGDFEIPSVYMKDTEGAKLLEYCRQQVNLDSKAVRIPEIAYNILGKKSNDIQRIVISAHIDAKKDSPGAIDNATGVTVLLLLSELLKDYKEKYQIELVFFNGEDYYAVSGQMKYIEQNEKKFGDVLLNINIDGVGYKDGVTSFSAFDLPNEIQKVLNELISNKPNIREGLPWYQGDHSIFLQYGRPAIAVSSHWLIENMECQDFTHTPKDNLNVVNYVQVMESALAIRDLINLLIN